MTCKYINKTTLIAVFTIIIILIFLLMNKYISTTCPICGNISIDCWQDERGVIYCKNELITYPDYSPEKTYVVDKRCISIGEYAFEGNKNLKSIIIQNGVSIIQGSAFACTNIESVVLPDSLLVIGDLAFMNCHQLKSITIPENVYVISHGAFVECPLSSIRIPASVHYIGSEAFVKTNLTDIYFEGDSFFTIDAAFRNNSHQQITFHFRNVDPDDEIWYVEHFLESYKKLSANFIVLYDD